MTRREIEERAADDAAIYVEMTGEAYDDVIIDPVAYNLFALAVSDLSETEVDSVRRFYFRALESESRAILS